MSDWLPFGVIGRAYGIKGWVHVHSSAVDPLDILSYKEWQLRWPTGDTQVVTIAAGRAHGSDGVVVHLKGCDDRDAARLLTGAEIWIAREALPQLDEDDFYLSDLVGFEVVYESGAALGKVKSFFSNSAHDIVVLTKADGTDKLVPFVMDDTVLSIDVDSQKIIMDWPEDA
ncbi:MAG: 16S rRNA processing protein RimM [Legionellales bacterium]|nr:16S rRNA processing protein RimM [Legionellales bacterium]|tara:strand:- start:128 stop:640 length:513 start_codon:yes stop_codon:yes gene_type:complete